MKYFIFKSSWITPWGTLPYVDDWDAGADLFLFKFSYYRLNHLGNRLPDDKGEYHVSVLAKNMEDAIEFVEGRLGNKIHVSSYSDKIPVNFIADANFQRVYQEKLKAWQIEEALVKKKFDLRKHMDKGIVEEPKKGSGRMVLPTF